MSDAQPQRTDVDPLARPERRGDDSARQMSHYKPAGRRRTLYEDVTCDTQPSTLRHLNRGWQLHFEDGRSLWSVDSTKLRSSDWYDFRDPAGMWERSYYQDGSGAERGIDAAVRVARLDAMFSDFDPEWVDFLRGTMQVVAFVEHGMWLPLATSHRDCLSDTLAHCVGIESAHKQRAAQALVLYAMDLEAEFGELAIGPCKQSFLTDEAWQPARRYLERIRTSADWGETIFAINLAFEPLVGVLLRRELLTRSAVASGDSVTPAILEPAQLEWEWSRDWSVAFCRHLLEDPNHAALNREVLEAWRDEWLPLAHQASAALERVVDGAPGNVAYHDARLRAEADLDAIYERSGLAAAGVGAAA